VPLKGQQPRQPSSAIERFVRYEEGRTAHPVFTNPRSIDAWRNQLTRRMLLPLLRVVPGSTWLTVGDGYYGTDANFLLRHGVQATASALSARVLSEAASNGWIGAWRVEDAQHLQVADLAFDWVLCMETIQHCDEPDRAVREVARVARRGVAIMTCLERAGRPFDRLRDIVRARRRGVGLTDVDRYPVDGPPLRRQSIGSIAATLETRGFAQVWARPFSVPPTSDAWDSEARPGNPAFIRTLGMLGLSRLLVRVHLLSPSFAWIIGFRDAEEPELAGALRAAGFAAVMPAVRPSTHNVST
jgi:SAM-dependent methyltransferase